MGQMRELSPRLQSMKEKFGDDKQKMQQAMMELYKTEKINPLGGCLPILIQIPVFIALYWVLLGSVELRNASFLYITDLSSKDPYYVLPLLMAASMFLQTKLNPKPTDPMQARLMMMMPIVFSIFFFFFPSGLVLYWLVNNILSITQQWYVNKKIHAEALKKKGHA
jgi:YidC/Oxa1 family membrane protein insertase